jgi:hypothetical protein
MTAEMPRAFDFLQVETAEAIDELLARRAPILAVILDGAMADPGRENALPAFSEDYNAIGGPVLLVRNEKAAGLRDLCARLNVSRMVEASHGSNALYSAVCTEIEEYRQRLSVRDAVRQGTHQIGDIEKATFRFRTREEAKNLATMLSSACRQPLPIAIGLTVLFVNAVEHGCLAIGHGEKGRLIEKGRLSEEILYRRSLPEYADRYVVVDFERTAERVVFDVRDPGEGFDHQSFVEDTAGHAKKHGRGITMAGGCFDELTYLGNGNHVRAVHLLTTAD